MKTIDGITTLDECDEVSAEVIEASRRALKLTTVAFAEALGWSQRKYQRVLEAAKDDGAVSRDVALAVRGASHILSMSGRTAAAAVRSAAGAENATVVPAVFQELSDSPGSWTEHVAPHVMRALAARASEGALITYGELAETLEDANLTHRVWPRTAYANPLGLVCRVCIEVREVQCRRVPLLTAIVVRAGKEPGVGFDGMVRHFFKKHEGSEYLEAWRRYKADRANVISNLQKEVFRFKHWDEVLTRVGLNPVT